MPLAPGLDSGKAADTKPEAGRFPDNLINLKVDLVGRNPEAGWLFV